MSVLGDLLLVLAGFGVGAIAAGWWLRRRHTRKLVELRAERIGDACRHFQETERLNARIALAQGEAQCWHRHYLAAAVQQRAVVEHRYIFPDDESESWKRGQG